jgi:hypothetical protein
LPKLQTLVFDCTSRPGRFVYDSPIYIPTLTAQPIPEGILPGFWSTPKLAVFHLISNLYPSEANVGRARDLQALHKSGDVTAVLRCYSLVGHPASVIYHFRMRLQKVLVEDQSPTLPRRDYTAWFPHMSDIEGTKAFLSVEERVWQDYTLYYPEENAYGRPLEEPVPGQVLARMREIEGASEAEWNQRGIEVSEEGWGPMREWLSGRVA